MKAYLAAPIFNEQQRAVVEGLKVLMESCNITVFSPYHASRDIWKGRAPMDCTPEERKRVLQGNIRNLHCDLIVAWVGGNAGGFTDPGVVWELGYGAALSGAPAAFGGLHLKGPYLLAYIDPMDVRQAMNLMLAGTVDAVVQGMADLKFALQAAELGHWHRISENFSPDRLLKQEKEPIV